MIPEQAALEIALASIFREVSTAARLADMAGLDVVQIDRTGSSADVWHSIIGMAIQDGVLNALVDRARVERPRNKELAAAWAAYAAAEGAHAVTEVRKPRQAHGSYPPPMSDNWRYDVRIDALQKEVADLRTIVAELKTTLSYLVSQNNQLNEQNKMILAVLEKQNRTERATQAEIKSHDEPLPHDLKWYLAIAAAIVITVLVVSYFGGNIP